MNSSLIPSRETRKLKVRPVGSGLLLAERLEAKREAERIVQAARRKGEDLLAEARSQSAKIRERAEQDGERAGLEKVARRVAEAYRWGHQARKKFKVEMADLASEIARRILRRELIMNPDSVDGICRAVLRENPPGEHLVVYVNPDDLAVLKTAEHPLVSDPQATVELHASKKVARGGCLVRGEFGVVDGRLSVQIAELTRVLKETIND
jgi:flagellar biosynthesis/type III secretory pathway protein FliH